MKRAFIPVDRIMRELALRSGVGIEEVRREIKLAMPAGLCDPDPAVRARWRDIPSVGEVPTPEELIVYPAEIVSEKQ